jgi:p-hydroxybenzoate 3-monooxygenase
LDELVGDRTQVGIVGAGPAGLLLSHLLHLARIDSVVFEVRDRDYVERRVRAGVLEQGTVDLLNQAGVGDRMRREGLVHEGVNLAFAGERHRIDFRELTGQTITVYGQQEVVKDLIDARLAAGGKVLFGAEALCIDAEGTEGPRIQFRDALGERWLRCEFIAACDGSHGIGRKSVGDDQATVFEREYAHGWLGILAASAPISEELIYAYGERGFALHSMRSPEISRLYLQVPADEDLRAWPDDLVWEELRARLAEPELQAGEILEKSITPMRSMVLEPMRYGRLFLAGDAAHIVPPTGAKGMNLAIADVGVLATALAAYYRDGSEAGLDAYSDTCLRRVWRAEHFSYWMTNLLHRDPAGDPFEHRLRLSHLRYITHSRAAAASLAENYVGLAPA